MEADVTVGGNRNLTTALIALIVLVVVVVFYWDRQKQRELRQFQNSLEAELLEEWGPESGQRVRGALRAQPVAFSRRVSYKNVVARIAPSVVSVNVGSSFINNGGLGIQGQAVAGTAEQNVGQPGSNWGGRMGGWGLGPGGYLVCQNCGTKVPHQRGVPAYSVSCPSCGMGMVREDAPGTGPVVAPVAAGAQTAAQQGGHQFQALGRGGSGVIINRLGYVLTNHHVIHGARSITVTLSSGRLSKTYDAQLIDEAPELDFAVLKILAKGNEEFAPAVLGDSNAVSVGDEVLALGSPFGLQQSVTFGIVSNTNRTLIVGNETFSNIIQTDAPINPGSSGGPLVNLRGEVIGINTAIYSPTRAFSGIGFASPINPAREAFPEFVEKSASTARAFMGNTRKWAVDRLSPGRGIQRGQGLYPWGQPDGGLQQAASAQGRPWLGMRVGTVDKEIKTYLKLPMSRGVVVLEVFDNSPSHAAGVQGGDVITRVNNRSVRDDAMFGTFLSKKKPGQKIKLTIYRDGKRLNLRPVLGGITTGVEVQTVALPGRRFDPANATPPGLTGPLRGSEVGAGEIEALGMGVEDLAPELALAYGIPKGERGVIITESAGQAEVAGLLAGDVIKSINFKRVDTVTDFIKVMGKADLKRGILLDIYRQGQRFQVTMKGN